MAAELIMITPPDPERLAWYEQSDLGNAERMKARSGGHLLHVRGRGWIAWDGRRWSYDDGERQAEVLAHDVARAIRDEVAALGEQIRNGRLPKSMLSQGEEKAREIALNKLESLHKWAIKSGNTAQIRGMVSRAAAEMTVLHDEFDVDPLALNCRSGTLRFIEAGGEWGVEHRPHDPVDRITRLAEVVYDPAATCPEWEARMALIQPDEDARAKLQVLFGYCLLGLTSDQQFYIFQGPGGDGKSMTVGVFSKLMGDYHRHAKVQSFLEGPQRGGSDHSGDIARLSGDVRLVTCSEPKKRDKWDANVIKEWTGSGTITARALREAEFEFSPRGKLLVECNGLPAVPVSDDGWWRRVNITPWPFQFAKMGVTAEQPHLLEAKLMAEASGILNWAIRGALRWLREGRVPVARKSEKAVSEYRRSTDPFDEWYLDLCVTNDSSQSTLSTVLYGSFKAFCEAAGQEKIMSQKTFGLKLAEKQHERHKSNGQIWRIGIRLKTEAEREAEERVAEARDRAAGLHVVGHEIDLSNPDPLGDDW